MPAKKKTAKAPAKAPVKSEAKTECACDCGEKCTCNCAHRSQLSFYVLIALLVASMTVLIISLAFNRSVRDIFRPENYAYNGMFDTEVQKGNKDESGITILSAGAVIDMISSKKAGLLIVGEENCLGCDAFARRVANYDGKKGAVYRYNAPLDATGDSSRAKELLGTGEAPDFVYIKDGKVFDRIDDVKDLDDLAIFLDKYN